MIILVAVAVAVLLSILVKRTLLELNYGAIVSIHIRTVCHTMCGLWISFPRLSVRELTMYLGIGIFLLSCNQDNRQWTSYHRLRFPFAYFKCSTDFASMRCDSFIWQTSINRIDMTVSSPSAWLSLCIPREIYYTERTVSSPAGVSCYAHDEYFMKFRDVFACSCGN